MWRRYVLHYFRRFWGLIYGAFMGFLFLLAMLVAIAGRVIETALVFFEVWLFFTAVSALWIFVTVCLGLRLLRKQEVLLGVSFHTEKAAPLHPKSVLCFSDDWVCLSPQYIFHRRFITSISVVIKRYRGFSYFCRIKCTDGKIRLVHVFSASDANAVRRWYKKGSA